MGHFWRGARDFFKTTNASFAVILGVYGLGAAILSYLLAVPIHYAALTIAGPFGVWWLCRREQSSTLAAKDTEIAEYKKREDLRQSEAFRITGVVRGAAAKLPYHVGLGHGAGEFKTYLELAPSRIPDKPTFSALRGKVHEAYLWTEQWASACKESRQPGHGSPRKPGPTKADSMKEAGRYMDEIMRECEALEQKARRGEV